MQRRKGKRRSNRIVIMWRCVLCSTVPCTLCQALNKEGPAFLKKEPPRLFVSSNLAFLRAHGVFQVVKMSLFHRSNTHWTFYALTARRLLIALCTRSMAEIIAFKIRSFQRPEKTRVQIVKTATLRIRVCYRDSRFPKELMCN